jgi:hypothetical protein
VTVLAMTTDGRRSCIERTIPSLLDHVGPLDGPRLIFDDSGDADYRAWLRAKFRALGFEVVGAGARRGQGRAVAKAWRWLDRELVDNPRGRPPAKYAFWCEDDFIFERTVDLDEWRDVLDAHPYLAQIALVRQAWFPGEVAAGGIVERDPGDYERRERWLEHRRCFTLNPMLFRRSLCARAWPTTRRPPARGALYARPLRVRSRAALRAVG